MGRPWATFWLTTAVLAFGLLPPLASGGDSPQPSPWLAPLLAGAWGPVVAPLAHVGVAHALLVGLGVAVAGFGYEPGFGAGRTLAVAAAGVVTPIFLGPVTGFVAPGAGGAAMALFGGWLLDLARRGQSRSLFGPLVAPMLLHGALEMALGAPLGLAHGAAFAAGALLTRLLPSAERTAPTA